MNDRRHELVDALLTTAKHLERCAHLLSREIVPELDDDAELLTILPGTNKTLNLYNYPNWPAVGPLEASNADAYDLKGLEVLEYNAGPSSPTAHRQAGHVDLITDDFKFTEQPPNVRIVSAVPDHKYDVGVIWESLEFCRTPVQLLQNFRRCCKRLVLRLRPWSGRNGAFLDTVAYGHLARAVDSKVQSRFVRPLLNYQRLFANAGLAVQERQVNTAAVEPFFGDEVLGTIIERTWGEMRPSDALRVMAISSMDFVTC